VSIFNYDQTDCFSGGCVENFDTFDEFESITRFCGRIDFKVRVVKNPSMMIAIPGEAVTNFFGHYLELGSACFCIWKMEERLFVKFWHSPKRPSDALDKTGIFL
jgi:hypothetical protein